MYCRQCGADVANSKFCAQCGAVVNADGFKAQPSKLVRPRAERKIAGVCAALSNGYGWDLTVVRIVALVLAVWTGVGLVMYLICWICIPEEPEMVVERSSAA